MGWKNDEGGEEPSQAACYWTVLLRGVACAKATSDTSTECDLPDSFRRTVAGVGDPGYKVLSNAFKELWPFKYGRHVGRAL
jgi:hypothetical protein